MSNVKKKLSCIFLINRMLFILVYFECYNNNYVI